MDPLGALFSYSPPSSLDSPPSFFPVTLPGRPQADGSPHVRWAVLKVVKRDFFLAFYKYNWIENWYFYFHFFQNKAAKVFFISLVTRPPVSQLSLCK